MMDRNTRRTQARRLLCLSNAVGSCRELPCVLRSAYRADEAPLGIVNW